MASDIFSLEFTKFSRGDKTLWWKISANWMAFGVLKGVSIAGEDFTSFICVFISNFLHSTINSHFFNFSYCFPVFSREKKSNSLVDFGRFFYTLRTSYAQMVEWDIFEPSEWHPSGAREPWLRELHIQKSRCKYIHHNNAQMVEW